MTADSLNLNSASDRALLRHAATERWPIPKEQRERYGRVLDEALAQLGITWASPHR